ncbi:FAD-dependent oxidoreductase [Rhodoferax aquaticus]|uniref:Pyridine nucleotide-disulfide oxidoreductase n=1 Tax=Rhodoferax aquaticus TaxID=2527691 RepID=A0A515EST3_9BURK|nr:FAD-dependent oxidoreductase [Rhodoferax aquaticus]QDL55729.1 pyridine nucleotide-disulfide oxidoreductase [Rhodoferax aquaticus]
MTDTFLPTHNEHDTHVDGPGYQPRQLVLLGAGFAHLQMLAKLAQSPLIGVRIILVAPHPRQIHASMVPGFVAGHFDLDECAVAMEPLVRLGGVRWLQRSVKALNAETQFVQLDDGSRVHYDWLSVNTGAIQNRDLIDSSLPGARAHGLFIRPLEAFSALWPRISDKGNSQALRIAVIGGGASGVEMAMAVRHRLKNAAVTLVSGSTPPGANYSPSVQKRLLQALKKRRITVLQDTATRIHSDAVHLGCGARLACDVPLIALGVQAPVWLTGSGLDLDSQGFIAVDKYQRSTSHASIFAAGDVCTRTDRAWERNGVYAMRAGKTLVRNLAAVTSGARLHAHSALPHSLNLLSCGGRYAIASWGSLSAQGHWVWWLKAWIDRRFIARFSRAPA